MKRNDLIGWQKIYAGAIVGLAIALSTAGATAQERSIRASGLDSGPIWHGNVVTGTTAGKATPFGNFTGTYSGVSRGQSTVGIETWTFSNGDTLTWAWELSEVEAPIWGGTYVVTGGTGRFSGASGSAQYTWTGQGNGTALFELVGTISF